MVREHARAHDEKTAGRKFLPADFSSWTGSCSWATKRLIVRSAQPIGSCRRQDSGGTTDKPPLCLRRYGELDLPNPSVDRRLLWVELRRSATGRLRPRLCENTLLFHLAKGTCPGSTARTIEVLGLAKCRSRIHSAGDSCERSGHTCAKRQSNQFPHPIDDLHSASPLTALEPLADCIWPL